MTPDENRDAILATARELYGRLVYTHLTHEKERQLWSAKVASMKWANILSAGATTIAAIVSVAIPSTLAMWITTLLAAITVSFAIWQANFDPSSNESQQRVAAKELLWLREQFLLLIAECHASTVAEADLGRSLRSLTRELTAIYKFAPNTSSEAYDQARKAIQAGHFTLSDDEIDAMLPTRLRKGNKGLGPP